MVIFDVIYLFLLLIFILRIYNVFLCCPPPCFSVNPGPVEISDSDSTLEALEYSSKSLDHSSNDAADTTKRRSHESVSKTRL